MMYALPCHCETVMLGVQMSWWLQIMQANIEYASGFCRASLVFDAPDQSDVVNRSVPSILICLLYPDWAVGLQRQAPAEGRGALL